MVCQQVGIHKNGVLLIACDSNDATHPTAFSFRDVDVSLVVGMHDNAWYAFPRIISMLGYFLLPQSMWNLLRV